MFPSHYVHIGNQYSGELVKDRWKHSRFTSSSLGFESHPVFFGRIVALLLSIRDLSAALPLNCITIQLHFDESFIMKKFVSFHFQHLLNRENKDGILAVARLVINVSLRPRPSNWNSSLARSFLATGLGSFLNHCLCRPRCWHALKVLFMYQVDTINIFNAIVPYV